MIDLKELKAFISYDSETGEFTWIKGLRGVTTGKSAGSLSHGGYIKIGWNGVKYYAHQVAWLYMTGEWPMMDIDHADGDPSNNAWNNLRLATMSQNQGNRHALKRGIERHGRKWRARIEVDGVRYELGSYATEEEAQAAYDQAATEVWGEFARCNRD